MDETFKIELGKKPFKKDKLVARETEYVSVVIKNKDIDATDKTILEKVIDFMRSRETTTIEIKGIPKEQDTPLIIEELILEINYLYNEDEKYVDMQTESALKEWIKKKNVKELSYWYSKYLMAWKVLTNDVKVFAPIDSKSNINIETIIKWDKSIPEELREAVKFEDDDYKYGY